MIKKEAEKIQKNKNLKIAVWCLWNLKTEMILIPEQQPEKTRFQGNTENSHSEHCTHSSGRTNVKD